MASQEAHSLGFLGDDAWQHHFHVVRPWQDPDHWDRFTSLEQMIRSREPMGTRPK